MNLEEFMIKEGWIQKCYWNCGVPYIAWHKEGVQIDEGAVEEIDKLRDWEVSALHSNKKQEKKE